MHHHARLAIMIRRDVRQKQSSRPQYERESGKPLMRKA
jgi:hypothetical protein